VVAATNGGVLATARAHPADRLLGNVNATSTIAPTKNDAFVAAAYLIWHFCGAAAERRSPFRPWQQIVADVPQFQFMKTQSK
jgi:hypothetical protein